MSFIYIRGKAREQQRINHNWEVVVLDDNTNDCTLDDIISMLNENKDSSSKNESSNKATLDDIINTPSETNIEIYDNTKANDIINMYN